MSLTHNQLKSLRYDLQELAHIEYEDVLNELIDHYATLTEQKITEGHTFEKSSKWAWQALGAEDGIQAIQKNYVKHILRQVEREHIAILKNYFRLPSLMTTSLAGLLLYLVVPLLPFKPFLLSVVFIGFGPLMALGWGYMRSVDKRIATGKIVWQYMQHKGIVAINLIQLGLNLPSVFFENGRQMVQTFLQIYPMVAITICFLTLFYSISFIQLFRLKFYHKIA